MNRRLLFSVLPSLNLAMLVFLIGDKAYLLLLPGGMAALLDRHGVDAALSADAATLSDRRGDGVRHVVTGGAGGLVPNTETGFHHYLVVTVGRGGIAPQRLAFGPGPLMAHLALHPLAGLCQRGELPADQQREAPSPRLARARLRSRLRHRSDALDGRAAVRGDAHQHLSALRARGGDPGRAAARGLRSGGHGVMVLAPE